MPLIVIELTLLSRKHDKLIFSKVVLITACCIADAFSYNAILRMIWYVLLACTDFYVYVHLFHDETKIN